ncbi:3-oxoacyl-[acyl-carrier protein] reductase/2-deoxy-D-gluconate 3-dehydrogenase [Fodinibius roseus]|uniref:3-oxoacyl-[acyl-carrier protein] reductase/2-deoxy-D-gluconate 3-dehydrogenase n=1 Tax=Fodinibius roseus TaxID=1194090 RepID=A0A1M5GFY0_9BACT|nr:SDR family oxidoreductase [Fodinibius roseus]SHG02623.1 3-oxoacyl-[acyl-carrier protein] reductase/2-deoxy-D-gluconate 3-dehydrogenase [Fodinibius roseus]
MDMNSLDFSGKNILVTGGGGAGVGAGVCNVLARFGATLIINERKVGDAQRAAQRYSSAVPVAADIRKEDEIKRMFEHILKQVDGIHGLVNNAGVGLHKMAHKATEEEVNRIYDTDMKGVWHVSKAFANHLIQSGGEGNIVNISSVHARATWSGYAIYSSVKSAVEGLTRGMAVELGPKNIRVNAVAPGYVHSEQNYDLISSWSDNPEQWVERYIDDYQALSFEIEPDDCGNAVAFLLSDLSRAITGQTLHVDNGTTSLMSNYSFIKK